MSIQHPKIRGGLAGGLVIIASIVVLIGWFFDIGILKSIFPGLVTMKANTAACLMFGGIALVLLSSTRIGRSRRFCVVILALLMMLLGALTLGEYFLGYNFHIDELLFRDAVTSVGTSQSGRMSPSSAFSFILVGIGLLVASQPVLPRSRIALLSALAATVSVIGAAATLGQISNALFDFHLWNYFGMAVHTAAGFFLLGLGLWMCAKSEGEMRWALDRNVTIGFIILVAIMLTAAGVSWDYTNRLQQTALLVSHTHQVLKQIEDIRADKAILESNQRGYVILGDEKLLASREQLKAEVRRDVADLRKLTSDDPQQQKHLDQLEPLMTQRTTFAEQLIITRRVQGFPAAQQMLATGPGLALSAEIARLLDAMHEKQSELLLARENEADTVSKATFLLLPIAVFLSLTLLSVALFFLNAGVSEQAQAEKEIRRLNTSLEQRVAERNAELDAAKKELEAFSYSVSHDLRAPLRAVDGFSQSVLEDYGAQLPPEGRHDLQTIREGAQRMGTLIDDLLTFSRLSRAPLKEQSVDTQEMVRNVMDDLNSERQGREIEFKVEELPGCRGDPSLLKQVWVNLLSNAVKYTRQRNPAVIEVGCKMEQEKVYFVRDNGAGFNMKYVHKLFGVFQRLHRADQFEGTGVGLAIVQRIIHRHGGRIWAEAELDRGATFYFTLKERTEP